MAVLSGANLSSIDHTILKYVILIPLAIVKGPGGVLARNCPSVGKEVHAGNGEWQSGWQPCPPGRAKGGRVRHPCVLGIRQVVWLVRLIFKNENKD